MVPGGTNFQLMMHQNSADINGFSSKCLECHPGNRKYLREAHVRAHRLCHTLVNLLRINFMQSWTDGMLRSHYLVGKAGADPGGGLGAQAPLTTKSEAPAPKFYKIDAPE